MTDDRTPFGGDDLTDLEERLRAAFAQEVRDLEPGDQLDDIRAEVDAAERVAGRPRWLAPVGAAAAVAAIAVVAWTGLRPGTTPPAPVAPSPVSTTVSALPSPSPSAPTGTSTTAPPTATIPAPPSTATIPAPPSTATIPAPPSTATIPAPPSTATVPAPPSTATIPAPPSTATIPAPPPTATIPAPPSTATTAAPSAMKSFAVPAYFVMPYGKTSFGLVREYIGTQLPVGADAVTQATAALGVSLNAQPYTNTDGYLQLWPSGTSAEVTMTANEIQVVLSGPGVAGLAAEQQRIAVQQVVWAVTAGVQKDVPVRISVAGGGNIFETMPANVYKRPADAQSYQDLAPIWVDNPSRRQVLPAGAPVVVKGQACTFEAGYQWELKRGAALAKKGFGTVPAGACPVRGEYSIDLGKLPAGNYSIRVFASSAEDGSVHAQKVVSFSVT